MLDAIYKLSRRLFPTGRAFRVPYGSSVDKLIRAFSLVEKKAVSDATRTLDSILADNDGFDTDDATDWNIRLGMPVNENLTLADRKAAILRKYNHPGNIPARQNYRYLERELRLAGFDVYVYENRFDDGMYGFETQSPSTVSSTMGNQNQLGKHQLGQQQLGYNWLEKVAKNLDSNADESFNPGTKLRRTFFVGGSPIGTFADVDASRETEFRELIFKIKPAQTIGYLFINYV